MPTAVVTGAASGIGRALSRQLAADGYSVHLADIAHSHDPAAELGGISHLLDITDPDAVQLFADTVGHVDLICLNARHRRHLPRSTLGDAQRLDPPGGRRAPAGTESRRTAEGKPCRRES